MKQKKNKLHLRRTAAWISGISLLLLCLFLAGAALGFPWDWIAAYRLTDNYMNQMYTGQKIEIKKMRYESHTGDMFYCTIASKEKNGWENELRIAPSIHVVFDFMQKKNGEYEKEEAAALQNLFDEIFPDAEKTKVDQNETTGGWKEEKNGYETEFVPYLLIPTKGELRNQVAVRFNTSFSEAKVCRSLQRIHQEFQNHGQPISQIRHLTFVFHDAALTVKQFKSEWIETGLEDYIHHGVENPFDEKNVAGEEKAAYDRGEKPVIELETFY